MSSFIKNIIIIFFIGIPKTYEIFIKYLEINKKGKFIFLLIEVE